MKKSTEMATRDKWEVDKDRRQDKLRKVKALLASNAVKELFSTILGKKSVQFTASLVNVVSGSDKLLDCDPNSIMSAAFVAATYDLPIDSNLGFSAIVPYKSKAQFQMMYKRTHEYEKMNCSEVYEDEMESYNPITGECRFVTDFSQCTQRAKGETGKIAGYYAWFRLLHGYTAELYMSRAEVENHARKYSQSYRYDLRSGKQSSIWTTNFDAMAKKTVLKLLLSKWGILSIEVQRAIEDDQKVYEASGEGMYADNQGEAIAAEDPFMADADSPEDVPEMREVAVSAETGKIEKMEEESEVAEQDEEPEEVDITKL